jgi:hypothetical protein
VMITKIPRPRSGDFVLVGSCYPEYASYGQVIARSGINVRVKNLDTGSTETWDISYVYLAPRLYSLKENLRRAVYSWSCDSKFWNMLLNIKQKLTRRRRW